MSAPDDAWLHFADALLARHAIAHGAESTVAIADLDAAVAQTRDELRRSFDGSGPFAILVANAALTPVDGEVLALAAACEDAPRRRGLLRFGAEGDRGSVTVDVVRTLLGPEHVLALAPDAALLSAGLVELINGGTWSDQIVSVHPTVLWALSGSSAPDPSVPVDATLVVTDQTDGSAFTVVAGPDRMRRREAAATHTRGTRFIVTPMPTSVAEWTAVVREATLIGCGVIVEIDETLPAIGRRWISRAHHLPWAITSPHELPVADLPNRAWVEIDVRQASATEEEQVQLLGPAAATHKLSFDQLHTVARVLPARSGDLGAAIRRLGSGKLEKLARRIRPTRSWDDIVLADEQLEQLHGLIARYRFAHRVYGEWGFTAQPSTGIVALFAGSSGTGKTLAAEIVAGDLGLDLFKLDLSAVVSKYIGETEKNLEEVFDAASAGNMVLFFDEADSLFGKRAEVRDAHDRYANIEVSYLLQRLEAYEGLVILATNFEKNIDEAFTRRIHVRVEFALPGVDERELIWKLNLPKAAPVVDVDPRLLAERFEISGATIRNAAIRSAFTAAAAGTPISMDGLVAGVAQEFLKAGRLLNPEHFGAEAHRKGSERLKRGGIR